MASRGKSYPDRSRNERRRPFRQEPTVSPEEEREYLRAAAIEDLMREVPGDDGTGYSDLFFNRNPL